MNHQSRITLKPNAVPIVLLSHFKRNNSPKNLNKKSLLNTNIIREACQHATKMITKNTSSSSMPRRTPRQPSILHLIVPNNGGIQDTFYFKKIFVSHRHVSMKKKATLFQNKNSNKQLRLKMLQLKVKLATVFLLIENIVIFASSFFYSYPQILLLNLLITA